MSFLFRFIHSVKYAVPSSASSDAASWYRQVFLPTPGANPVGAGLEAGFRVKGFEVSFVKTESKAMPPEGINHDPATYWRVSSLEQLDREFMRLQDLGCAPLSTPKHTGDGIHTATLLDRYGLNVIGLLYNPVFAYSLSPSERSELSSSGRAGRFVLVEDGVDGSPFLGLGTVIYPSQTKDATKLKLAELFKSSSSLMQETFDLECVYTGHTVLSGYSKSGIELGLIAVKNPPSNVTYPQATGYWYVENLEDAVKAVTAVEGFYLLTEIDVDTTLIKGPDEMVIALRADPAFEVAVTRSDWQAQVKQMMPSSGAVVGSPETLFSSAPEGSGGAASSSSSTPSEDRRALAK